MKILAIRGENLASLARPFELDLTSEPLAGVGLFAITGETGSGKSTILDALCLGLYGEYPRVAVGRQERVPDPSGQELSIGDERAILRRGASSGFAEVDFVGHDGLSYRSRWAVSRAYGRANGRLGSAQRKITRLHDGLAISGISPVLREVETRTNLTFNQFRRTVLLAQGDFDAFLLASESDRSDLLEKVTGTEIYGLISMQVRQGTEELAGAVEALDSRRRDIGLLEPASRATLEQAQKVLEEAVAAHEGERTHLNEKIEKLRRLSAAKENLRLAELELERASRKCHEAEPDIAAQAERDQAEGLRSLHVLAASAASALPATATRLSDAEQFEVTAKASKAEAEEQLAMADRQAAAAEEAFKNFGPVWTEAERLDAGIALAEEEVKSAQREYEQANEAVTAQESLHRRLKDQLDKTSTDLADACREIEAMAGVANLAERLDDVVALLDTHAQRAEKGRHADTALAAAADVLARLESKVSTNERNIAAADGLRKQLSNDADQFRKSLVELDENAMQLRESELSQLHIDLREAHRIAERASTAEESLATAEAAFAESKSQQDEAVREIAEAVLKMDRDSAARSLLIPLNDLAEQSISEQAEHLRGFVLEGKECPVCGATEHPYLRSGDGLEYSGALQMLAASMRNQRQELDSSIQVSTNVKAGAMGRLAAAEARCSQAEINALAARNAAAKARSEYAELKPSLAIVLGAHGLPNELPEILDGNAKSLITERGQLAKAAHSTAKKGLTEVRKLRTQLEQVQEQEAAAQKSFEKKTLIHQELTEQKHGAELVLGQERASQQQNKTELDSIERDLTPFLAPIGLELESLNRNPVEVLAKVNAEAQDYRALKAKVEELELVQRRLEPELAAAKADTGGKKEREVHCKAVLEQRRDSLQIKLNERKQLLGGEDTASHRTRHNKLRLDAIAERQRSHSQQGEAASAHRGAIVALENARRARADAERHAESTQDEFAKVCTSIGRSPEWVTERLTMPSAVRDEIRERLRGIADAVTTSQTTRTMRLRDVETASAEVDETEDINKLSTSLTIIGGRISEKQKEMGENVANLRRDDEARVQATALANEIGAKRKHLAVWQAVDDAIGSADGSRFRKFVQGITLEHLIVLANDHLSALGPRYQLSQAGSSELAVHVIDKEMADELRATRSLSGGERFLVSLSLALALSGLEGRSSFVDTLFIDEGFGTLDRDTLDVAVDALETLQSHGRKVAVITHVAAMIDRIAVQVRVEKLGGGHSVIKLAEGVVI